MASAQTEESTKSCDNCICNRWQQPEDKSTILQCSRCKVNCYCSTQCQKEHWEKVHKKQCKYLAKGKVFPNSVHSKATCLVCKKETKAGRKGVSDPNNPVLPCTLPYVSGLDGLVGFPFPLAEMTGQFRTKTEATITVMMRILLKMKLTQHPAWCIDVGRAKEVYDTLEIARARCWRAYLDAVPGLRLDQLLGSGLSSKLLEMINLVRAIDHALKAAKIIDGSTFRLWDTVKILISSLHLITTEEVMNDCESFGLPELSEDFMRIRMSSCQVSSFTHLFVDKLEAGLVPYMTLVEDMCGGQLEQVCYRCFKDLTVSDVVLYHFVFPENVYGPVLAFGASMSTFLCVEERCLEMLEKIRDADTNLMVEYAKPVVKNCANRCDFCAKCYKGVKGHRCSRCLTKVYCGVDCRNLDWVVHKLVCREGEEKRKIKGGRQERELDGKEIYESFLEI